jgi:2-polyprenyl-3-methyl-5-hydroxy-6-metoxy-1,4-benzoquinol methylase
VSVLTREIQMIAASGASPTVRGEVPDTSVVLRKYRISGAIDTEACLAFHELQIRWDPAAHVGFANPLPSEKELERFYSTGYRRAMRKAVGIESYVASPNYLAQARSLVAWVEPLLPSEGRWLDVGAAYGLLLSEVRRVVPRWSLHAVEPSADARPALEQIAELEMDFPAFWRGRTGERSHFDVVSLVHVLEHLRDPWSALRELRARLKPGGLLLVEVPNDPVVELERAGRRNDLPHLWFFSEAGLCEAARTAGFEVLKSAQIGLRREGERAPLAHRIRRSARRVLRGRMSLVQDRDWYAEAPDRCDLRVLCRKAAGRD